MLAGWPPPSEGTVREGLSMTPPPSSRALCVPAGVPNPEHTHTHTTPKQCSGRPEALSPLPNQANCGRASGRLAP